MLLTEGLKMRVNQLVLNQPYQTSINNQQKSLNADKNTSFTGLNNFINESKFIRQHINLLEGSTAWVAMPVALLAGIGEMFNDGVVNKIIGTVGIGLGIFLFVLADKFGQLRNHGNVTY